jgi:hypothetical protein
MWRRTLPVLLAVAFFVAACGGGDSVFTQGGATTPGQSALGEGTSTTMATTTTVSGAQQAMADAIASGLLTGNTADLPLDAASAQCIGNGVVGVLGVDRLQQLGVGAGGDASTVFDQLSDSEIAAVMPVVLGCVDVQGLIVQQLTASGISQQSANCVADALTQGTLLQDLITAVLAGGDQAEPDPAMLNALLSAVTTCLTPEEMGNLGNLNLGG